MTNRDLRLVLTKDCNYRCTFCHQEGVSHELLEALNNDDYLFLYETTKKKENIEGVTLTGGEPLRYQNVVPLAKLLHDSGANITMVTNGALLDKHQEIGEYLQRINVSLHTLDQDQYANITQTKTKIEHVLSNIALFRKLYPNLAIRLNATIVKGRNDNFKDIFAMVAVAEQYGLSIKFVELYPNTDPGFIPIESIEPLLQKLHFEKVSETARQKIFQSGDCKIVLTKIFCGSAELSEDPEGFCRAENDLFVTPDGRISPCPANIQKTPLFEAIKSRDTEQVQSLLHQAISEVQESCVYHNQPSLISSH